MKKWMAMLLAVMLALPALAFAQGAVLLVELEQDAQLVENVAFDDGDFIKTYQLGSGAQVQLLRYASFDMTLGDLFASEWLGATDVRELDVNEIGDHAAQGLRFAYALEGHAALDVTLIVVNAGETLVFTAIYPQAMGTDEIDDEIEAMIASMTVGTEGETNPDTTAEVG